MTIFYNANDGSTVIGSFDGAGNFTAKKSYNLTPGFTQIVQTNQGVLFYRANDGSTVIGSFDGAGNFTAKKSYNLTPGFTQIIQTNQGVLFYRANDGSTVIGSFDGAGNFTAKKSYNLTPGFTQIVQTNQGVLFYKANDGSTVIGNFDGAGDFTAKKSYNLTPGFTQIVGLSETLFYNANDGSTVIGSFDGAGNFTAKKSYNLTPGFTQILWYIYNDVIGTTLAVNSTAAKFSPGNWKGDTGRVGSVYRQSWNNGAWFAYSWNASTSPTATILIASSSTSSMLSYYLNDVLVDNVAATGNIALSNIVANSVNNLVVYLRNSTQSSRWNNGTNVVQIQGLQIDVASSAATAPAAKPWVLIVGDSITEGIEANGSDDHLMDYSFLLGQALEQLGYDYAISASGYSSWLRTGDSPGDVPAYYSVLGSSDGFGGTYNDSASRWNKIDNGVSLLDSNSQISAYGATGTPPAAIYINYMTNEALSSSNASDAQASVTQAITALRAAAPSALIFIQIPFGLYNTSVYSSSATYINALKNGVAVYKTANPNDSNVLIVDFGATFSTTITSSPYVNSDHIHPAAAGHALIAPMVTSAIETHLTKLHSTSS